MQTLSFKQIAGDGFQVFTADGIHLGHVFRHPESCSAFPSVASLARMRWGLGWAEALRYLIECAMPNSWAPEVFVDGKWYRNGLRFATRQEAEDNAYDLYIRWTLTQDSRATEAEEPPNYQWIEGKLVPINEGDTNADAS